jgi:signal transduction histidine kinase
MQPRPIRSILIRDLALLGAVVIPLAAALSWFGLLHIVRGQAERRAAESLRVLSTQIGERLMRVSDAARSLAFLWSEGLIDPGRTDEARLYLFPLLGQLPGTGTVMLVRANDGHSFFAVRTADTYRNVKLEPVDDEHTDLTIVVSDLQGHLKAPEYERLPYHPLHRPWIEEARKAGGPSWSRPYAFKVFLDTPLERHIGITRSVPVPAPDGKTIGFVGIDLVLADFNALCEAVRPTPGSTVAVLDEDGRVLGSSVKGAIPLSRPDAEQFPVIAELVREGPMGGSGRTIEAQGQSWLARSAPLLLDGNRPWSVVLAIPEAELIGEARAQVFWLTLLLLAVFAIASLRLLQLGRRIAGALSSAAQAAREIDGASMPAVKDAGFEELASVGVALARSHQAIEARRQLEQQLMHSQRSALAGLLAGGLAHDVNNQLTVIVAELEAAREAASATPAASQILDRVERAVWRCAEAVRSLLAVARRGAPAFRTVDINEVVEETAMLVRRVLDARTSLELDLGKMLPTVEADPIQIEHVLLNLTLNARDAMPSGGVLRLGTAPTPSGGVKILVKDTGEGMTPEVRAKIFEPFFTTKGGRGTGLGLAMVKNIVRQHGGKLSVDTEHGRGTTFEVELEAQPAPPPDEIN